MKNYSTQPQTKLAAFSIIVAKLSASFLILATLMALALPGVSYAQSPNISYASPQTYTQGTAIPTLTPANSGGAVAAPGYSSTVNTIASGFNTPMGITSDAAGNVYVADEANNLVKKIPAGSSTPVSIGNGFSQPYAVAVDATGNVYVADYGTGSIKEINTVNGQTLTVCTGINGPNGVAIDGAGNIYVTSYNSGALYRILPGASIAVLYGSGFSSPWGVAVDGSGNVYVSDYANNTIKEVPAGGGAAVTLASGFANPVAVTVDGAGNLFVADRGNNALKEILAGSNTTVLLSTSFNGPNGVAIDGAGNVYISDKGNNVVDEIEPTGGYFISPFLPAGLRFNNTSGAITGTPAITGAAATYSIGAYNSAGKKFTGLSIAVNAAALPTLSYSSPHTYTQGTAIAPLSPTSTLVAAPGYNNNPVVIGSGFSAPKGLAVDAAGNVYVADFNNSQVKKIPAGGGSPVIAGIGFSDPVKEAIDAAGNVYVADYGNNDIKEIQAAGGGTVTLATGINGPVGIAVDGAGNVYVASYSAGALYKINAGSSVAVVFGTGYQNPYGVAVDNAGNVYEADYSNSTVMKIPAGGSTAVTIASGFSNPVDIAVDGAGNLFVADKTNSEIKEIPAGTSTPIAIGSGFASANGVAVDGAGNVYMSDGSNAVVMKIKPIGGYYVAPFLPGGLTISSSTGVISGTPVLPTALASYSVTAYNSYGGSKSASLNITVNSAPQVPTITYSSPQVYTAGTAVSPLLPADNTVGSAAYGNAITLVGTGLNFPLGVAVDAAGDVYVVDGNNQLKEFPAGGGAEQFLATGFSDPFGISVDAAGDIYIADSGNNEVKEIPAGKTDPIVIGSGFSGPSYAVADAAGNVYVADRENNEVKEILAGNGAIVGLGSGFASPSGVAVDPAGNVYVADQGNNAVKMIPARGGPVVTIATGIGAFGIAIDATGNLFVAGYSNNAVYEIPAGSSTSLPLGSGFSDPGGIALDNKGDVFVGDGGNNAIKKLIPTGGYYLGSPLPAGLTLSNSNGLISGTPLAASAATNYVITGYNSNGGGSGTINIKVNLPAKPTLKYVSPKSYPVNTAIAALLPTATGVAAAGYNSVPVLYRSGLNGPGGVAVDAAGNVYVADSGDGLVKKIPANGGVAASIGTGFGYPVAVAVDAAGNVYVADRNDNTVKKILANGSATTTIGTGFLSPGGVAVDLQGNVYVADRGVQFVQKIPAGGGTPVNIGSGLLGPDAVAVDGAGNVYVDDNSGDVFKISAADGTTTFIKGGYVFGGVAVDAAGNIFVSDANANYVQEIPANGGAAINLGSGFNNPEGLAVDGSGNIFVADLFNNAIKKIRPVGGYYINTMLPAGLSFNDATGAISGTPTATSPATNYTITGYNIGDGTAAAVNIKVFSNDASLSNIAVSSGALIPGFATGTLNYTVNVIYGTKLTITPFATDPNATIKVNGTAVVSGTPSPVQALKVGANSVPVVVTASNGTTTKTYTLTVNEARSFNDNLAALTLSSGSLSPGFAAGTTSYTAAVANTVSTLTVTPTTADTTATVTVNGAAVKSGASSPGIALAVGANVIHVVVTAQSTVTKTYTLTVTRAASANAALANLIVSNTTISPVFHYTTFSYAATVPATTTAVTITPSAADGTAIIKVNGVTVASKTASAPIALNMGSNTITTVVTAQNGVTVDTYTVVVTRAASPVATLSALTVSTGTLSPVFSTGNTNYSIILPASVTSMTVTPTATSSQATIKVNGLAATSGSPSNPITVTPGVHTITTVVTAQDGVTTDTYSITLYIGATNAVLSNLALNGATLSPAFKYTTTSYTSSVPNSTTSVTVTPSSADANTTIRVNGTIVVTKTASGAIALATGQNTINVVVKAQNGLTTDTYTIVVTRASGGADGYEPISVTTPTETPRMADDGINVHKGVSPNGDGIDDFLQIDNIGQYPDNKISIMNRNGQLVFEAKGYDNSSRVFDGHSSKNGQLQLPGTYFYELDYTVKGITTHKTGYLVLKY